MRCSIESRMPLTGQSASSNRRASWTTSSSAPSGSVISAALCTSCARVTGCGSVGMSAGLPAEHLRHPPLDRAAEGVPDRTLLEALDQLGHEALDHQPLARGLVQPARAQVEELLR